jgi:LPXTG-motif cell wall-anchored protein
MKLFALNRMLFVSLLCLILSATIMAQVQTETKTTQGQAAVETKVERGEVVAVSGNDLVVKMEDGQVRNFPDVPESATVTVNGQQLTVHDLRPGMKLERTITTTTTPQTVTTVKTVTGTVFQVMAPASVILRLEDGSTQQFQIPKDQKFTVDGKEVDAFHLRKGMQISATKIVTEPQTVVSEEKKVAGEMPAPPPPTLPTEAVQGPLLIQAQATPVTLAKAEAPAKEKLPQTASDLPLLTLAGAAMLLAGMAGLRSRAHSRN